MPANDEDTGAWCGGAEAEPCSHCGGGERIACLSRALGATVLENDGPPELVATALVEAGAAVVTLNRSVVGTPMQPLALGWAARRIVARAAGFFVCRPADLRLDMLLLGPR